MTKTFIRASFWLKLELRSGLPGGTENNWKDTVLMSTFSFTSRYKFQLIAVGNQRTSTTKKASSIIEFEEHQSTRIFIPIDPRTSTNMKWKFCAKNREDVFNV